MLNNGYLSLEVINGTNLPVPSERTPAGFYAIVSTPHGQWNTAVKAAMVDHSVPWNETLAMWAQPLMFPRWLMPIFPKKSKAVQLEIRASFEHGCLGRGELLGTFQTTLEELLLHAGKQFEIGLPVISAQCPSLLLKVKRSKAPRLPARTASNTQQSSGFHSVIGRITDKAHEAYTLYRRSDNPKYLDSAIQDFQEVLNECPKGHPHRGAALSNLAHAIISGFTKGVRADIDHAISLFRRALEHHHGEHPDHPLSILNLSKALHLRHSMGKNSADLHEAVVLCHSLLPLCLKDSHLHLHAIEQCNALPRNPSDESIMLRRIVLEHCQPRHPHRTRSLNRLARDLYARFEQSGNIDHINEAVQLSREALTSCPADGERSFYLSILSYYILKRFRHFRYTGDIEECISLNREALALCPPGHSAHERSLKYLAKALKARYDEYGNIVDFQEAMQLSRATHDVGSWNSGTLPHPSEYSGVYLDLERGPLTCTPEPEEEQRQPPLKSLMSDHQTQPRARNIVIFGEAGSGKSSVINAITQSHRAETSSSAAGCTFRYQRHGVEISGENFVLYDTVGLDEGTAGTVPAAEAEENLKSLLRELVGSGSNGISLLVYCVRSVRVSRALLRNYNLFYSAICRKKVPVVIVVTGLENQESTMDSWWDTNGMVFKKFGMYFEDHACVTTLRDSPDIPDVFAHRITESRDILRGLILNNCSEWMADDSWFKLSFADIRNMISGRWNGERSSPPTLVICDWPQKEVRLAHGIYGVVETCFVRIGGVKYQVHNVAEPEPSIPTSNVDADLLIYYVRADETAARQKFGTFCEAYRGNMVPVIVVVRGLNDTKAAQEWVERYLIQHSNGAGRPFSTFAPAGGARDRHAEQELQELIQQSCLIRSEGKGDGMHKSVVNFLGRWL